MKIIISVFCVIILCATSLAVCEAVEPRTGVDAARFYVDAAPSLYQAVFGRWPTSWAEVKESGLLTASLISMTGNAIDPDDLNYDGAYDVVYWYTPGQPPHVSEYMLDGQPPVLVSTAVTSQKTIHDVLEGTELDYLKDDQTACLHIAMANLLNRGIFMFRNSFSRYPSTWNELVASDVSPMAPGLVSKLTSKPYSGEGEPGDFRFKPIYDDSGAQISAEVYWVDTAGQRAAIFF